METYRMIEDFGDFEQWGKTYEDGLTARIGVKKGCSVEAAFNALENGYSGQIWSDEDC
jgi:hypothetical protein